MSFSSSLLSAVYQVRICISIDAVCFCLCGTCVDVCWLPSPWSHAGLSVSKPGSSVYQWDVQVTLLEQADSRCEIMGWALNKYNARSVLYFWKSVLYLFQSNGEYFVLFIVSDKGCVCVYVCMCVCVCVCVFTIVRRACSKIQAVWGDRRLFISAYVLCVRLRAWRESSHFRFRVHAGLYTIVHFYSSSVQTLSVLDVIKCRPRRGMKLLDWNIFIIWIEVFFFGCVYEDDVSWGVIPCSLVPAH